MQYIPSFFYIGRMVHVLFGGGPAEGLFLTTSQRFQEKDAHTHTPHAHRFRWFMHLMESRRWFRIGLPQVFFRRFLNLSWISWLVYTYGPGVRDINGSRVLRPLLVGFLGASSSFRPFEVFPPGRPIHRDTLWAWPSLLQPLARRPRRPGIGRHSPWGIGLPTN